MKADKPLTKPQEPTVVIQDETEVIAKASNGSHPGEDIHERNRQEQNLETLGATDVQNGRREFVKQWLQDTYKISRCCHKSGRSKKKKTVRRSAGLAATKNLGKINLAFYIKANPPVSENEAEQSLTDDEIVTPESEYDSDDSTESCCSIISIGSLSLNISSVSYVLKRSISSTGAFWQIYIAISVDSSP